MTEATAAAAQVASPVVLEKPPEQQSLTIEASLGALREAIEGQQRTLQSLRAHLEKVAPSGDPAAFATALARAQAKFGPIPRTKEVEAQRRDGRGLAYRFKYAPLEVVLAATMPALNAEGFALSQRIGKGEHGDYVETTLIHAHGERSNRTPVFVSGDFATAQGYASGVSYARRYGVTLLLGVSSEDDDDGSAADGNDARVIGPERTAFPIPAKAGPQQPTAAAPPQKGGKGARGKGQPVAAPEPPQSTVELEPGEQRRPAPIKQAFPPGERNGDWVDQLPDSVVSTKAPTTPEAEVRAEGKIADAIQEFHEAALEGRRIGIQQIWDEIRTDEYVATMTWRRLKEQFPDSFAVVSEVLRPRDTQARGPKK